MSPLNALLKCPHGKGQIIDEWEGADEVSPDGIGGRRADNIKGGQHKDGPFLSPDQAGEEEIL